MRSRHSHDTGRTRYTAHAIHSYFNLGRPSVTPPILFLTRATFQRRKTQTWPSMSPHTARSRLSDGPNDETSPGCYSMHGLGMHGFGVDPPRPPRGGFEWVWFPQGYWAERQLVDMPRKGRTGTRFWKWHSPSTKSASDADAAQPRLASPVATHSGSTPTSLLQANQSEQTALSPYLSESAHVLSLQHPLQQGSSHDPGDAPQMSSGYGTSQGKEAFGRKSDVWGDSTSPRARSTSSPLRKRFFTKAFKKIEAKVKAQGRKEVCSPLPRLCWPAFARRLS